MFIFFFFLLLIIILINGSVNNIILELVCCGLEINEGLYVYVQRHMFFVLGASVFLLKTDWVPANLPGFE